VHAVGDKFINEQNNAPNRRGWRFGLGNCAVVSTVPKETVVAVSGRFLGRISVKPPAFVAGR
jgi:hypothetical protein